MGREVRTCQRGRTDRRLRERGGGVSPRQPAGEVSARHSADGSALTGPERECVVRAGQGTCALRWSREPS
jgi:hypothetical protein